MRGEVLASGSVEFHEHQGVVERRGKFELQTSTKHFSWWTLSNATSEQQEAAHHDTSRLVGKWVDVQGLGMGQVIDFQTNYSGNSKHTIHFVDHGVKQELLKRWSRGGWNDGRLFTLCGLQLRLSLWISPDESNRLYIFVVKDLAMEPIFNAIHEVIGQRSYELKKSFRFGVEVRTKYPPDSFI